MVEVRLGFSKSQGGGKKTAGNEAIPTSARGGLESGQPFTHNRGDKTSTRLRIASEAETRWGEGGSPAIRVSIAIIPP